MSEEVITLRDAETGRVEGEEDEDKGKEDEEEKEDEGVGTGGREDILSVIVDEMRRASLGDIIPSMREVMT